MKKRKLNLWLMLLMLGLIMTSNGFSQTVTKDSTQILLPAPVAKLVVKDLIRYDGLKIEIKIKDQIIVKKDSIISKQDSINIEQSKIIGNLYKDALLSNAQLLTQQKISQSYKDALNRQKGTTWLVGGIGVAVGILVKVLFIK